MTSSENVVIGLGNSKGRLSKTLIQQKYQIIERINLKPSIALPKITPRRIPDIDLGIYKNLISKRRNQKLLQSFIGLNEGNNWSEALYGVCEEGKKQIASIKSELQTLVMLGEELKNTQFMKEAKATQKESEEYLKQFNGNTNEAVAAYKQRTAIVQKFAEEKKMSFSQAMAILKPNGYNVSLFD